MLYLEQLRDSYRNRGVEASVSDVDGQLSIVSDAFKLKPDRDEFIRLTFKPSYRQSLCKLGFKSYAVKSGVMFGDGEDGTRTQESRCR
jgi:hypothetical protein